MAEWRKLALFILRGSQIVLAVAILVPAGMSLQYMDYMRQLFDQATSSTSTTSPSSLMSSHSSPPYNSEEYKKAQAAAEQAIAQLEADSQKLQKTAMSIFDGGLAAVAITICVCITTIILSSVFAILTASTKARGQAQCIGNTALCSNYTCDFIWDIVLAVLWAVVMLTCAGFLGTVNKYIAEDNIHWQAELPAQFRTSQSSSADVKTSNTAADKALLMLVRGRSLLATVLVFALIQLATFVLAGLFSMLLRRMLRAQAAGTNSAPGADPVPTLPSDPKAAVNPVYTSHKSIMSVFKTSKADPPASAAAESPLKAGRMSTATCRVSFATEADAGAAADTGVSTDASSLHCPAVPVSAANLAQVGSELSSPQPGCRYSDHDEEEGQVDLSEIPLEESSVTVTVPERSYMSAGKAFERYSN